jgi:tyrosine-protein kinase Etk/Wzc
MTPITEEYRSQLDSTAPSGIEFDLFDLLIVLAERKRSIFVTTILGVLIALIVVTFVHPTFTSKALIMPPQQGQSGAALVSQIGGLAAVTGLGGNLQQRDPNDLFLGLLQSVTLEDALIKRFNLQKVYKASKMSTARAILEGNSKFMVEKGGLISISVKDQDPNRAAEIANAYVDELHKMNSRIAIGDAALRRVFFAEQLNEEKDRLADAEVALKKTEEETGAIAPGGQTSVVISQVAQLQAQIISREVQLETLRTSSTEQNPDVIRANSELESLRDKLHALQSSRQGHEPGDITLSPRGVPQAQLEFVRKQRDVTYHTLLFDLIARQFEGARLDEAKAAPLIQLVDPAMPPDRKSAPYRALWLLVGCFLGFFIGSVRVISGYVFGRVNADEVHSKRLLTLRRALRFGA